MELPGILNTIKADAGAWLADEQCANLRRILQQPRPPLQMPMARVARREADEHSGTALADATERAS
jgi:hypothetical protein